ncbi:MAG TPA: polysaccharide deacetylase family protein [Dissulfurispiraceae bacterium]|nr:polysaccharide deacetylase family protein [Dissulfurispiraceae bacterium]
MTHCSMTRRSFLACAGMLVMIPLFEGAAFAARAQKIPVLLYHDISGHNMDAYCILASDFAAQMEWLYEHGVRAVSLRDIEAGTVPDRSIVITFDDGYASFLEYAYPLFQMYGFKATVNIIGRYVGAYLPFRDNDNRPMLSWDEYRYLSTGGLIDFGCHTQDLHVFQHRGAAGVPDEVVQNDLRTFQRIMKQELGKPSDILAWPYGSYTERTVAIAREEGFRYLLTSNPGFMILEESRTEIPRLNVQGSINLYGLESLIEVKK